MLHPFALIYSVLADVPQHPDAWWMETPNNMGRCSINIYAHNIQSINPAGQHVMPVDVDGRIGIQLINDDITFA